MGAKVTIVDLNLTACANSMTSSMASSSPSPRTPTTSRAPHRKPTSSSEASSFPEPQPQDRHQRDGLQNEEGSRHRRRSHRPGWLHRKPHGLPPTANRHTRSTESSTTASRICPLQCPIHRRWRSQTQPSLTFYASQSREQKKPSCRTTASAMA